MVVLPSGVESVAQEMLTAAVRQLSHRVELETLSVFIAKLRPEDEAVEARVEEFMRLIAELSDAPRFAVVFAVTEPKRWKLNGDELHRRGAGIIEGRLFGEGGALVGYAEESLLAVIQRAHMAVSSGIGVERPAALASDNDRSGGLPEEAAVGGRLGELASRRDALVETGRAWLGRRALTRARRRIGNDVLDVAVDGATSRILYIVQAATPDLDRAASRTSQAVLKVLAKGLEPDWLVVVANADETLTSVIGPAEPAISVQAAREAARSNLFDLGNNCERLVRRIIDDSEAFERRGHTLADPAVVILTTELPLADAHGDREYRRLLDRAASLCWMIIGSERPSPASDLLAHPDTYLLTAHQDGVERLLKEVLSI